MKSLLLVVSLAILVFANQVTFAQSLPQVISWNLVKHRDDYQTIIAELPTPATYQVCRPALARPEDLTSTVYPMIDGTVYTDLRINHGSCVLLRGRYIGLWGGANHPVNNKTYFGTYKRLDEPNNWTTSVWGFEIRPGVDSDNVQNFKYLVASGALGYYRVCHRLVVTPTVTEDGSTIGGSTSSSAADPIGYFLLVDGKRIRRRPIGGSGGYDIRYGLGNCADVYGKDISVMLVPEDVKPTSVYRIEGFFQYIQQPQPPVIGRGKG